MPILRRRPAVWKCITRPVVRVCGWIATCTPATPFRRIMSRALSEYMITGIKTTIPFELAIMRDPNFRRGVYATNFIENMLANRRELIERDA